MRRAECLRSSPWKRSVVLPWLQDLLGALATLEPLELTAETRAHWTQLAEAAIDQEALAVAERCYAALGDVAKALYLHKVGHWSVHIWAGGD